MFVMISWKASGRAKVINTLFKIIVYINQALPNNMLYLAVMTMIWNLESLYAKFSYNFITLTWPSIYWLNYCFNHMIFLMGKLDKVNEPLFLIVGGYGSQKEKQARPHLPEKVSWANSFNVARPDMKMPCFTCLGTRYTFGELWNINIVV